MLSLSSSDPLAEYWISYLTTGPKGGDIGVEVRLVGLQMILREEQRELLRPFLQEIHDHTETEYRQREEARSQRKSQGSWKDWENDDWSKPSCREILSQIYVTLGEEEGICAAVFSYRTRMMGITVISAHPTPSFFLPELLSV